MKSDSFHQMSVCCNNLCVLPSDWACNPPPQLVLEPDPEKIEIEGLVDGVGWKCTLRNVRNFINC